MGYERSSQPEAQAAQQNRSEEAGNSALHGPAPEDSIWQSGLSSRGQRGTSLLAGLVPDMSISASQTFQQKENF